MQSIAVGLACLVCLAACGNGGGGSADAAGDGARICVPEGSYEWPSECDALACHDSICDVTCPTGATCQHLDCTDSPQCRIWCQEGTSCPNVDCRNSSLCFVDCYSKCEAACEGGDCQFQCNGGAECLLDCGSAPSSQCKLIGCTAGQTDCGNGIVVCNRPCP